MTILHVRASGLRFDVHIQGPAEGETVLLLHGFPHNHLSWSDVTPYLNRSGLRTVVFDQRGYGDGARPAEVSAYALPLLAEDALNVLDAVGAETAHVVGHDWGAAVAWYLGARHAHRVQTLTAVAIPHLDAYQDAYRRDPEQRSGSQYVEFLMSEGATETFLADNAAQLWSWFRQAGDVLTEEQIARDVGWHIRPGVLDAALNWYRANNLIGEPFDIGPVSVPTTLVWSRSDPAVSTSAAERTASYVTGPYRLVTLAKTSHWQPQQAPDVVSEEILRRVHR